MPTHTDPHEHRPDEPRRDQDRSRDLRQDGAPGSAVDGGDARAGGLGGGEARGDEDADGVPAGPADPLHDWVVRAADALEVDRGLAVDVTDPVLDMVREVAHGVVRPAGPMTAFLVGVVAGRASGAGADPAGVERQVLAALAVVERERARRDAGR